MSFSQWLNYPFRKIRWITAYFNLAALWANTAFFLSHVAQGWKPKEQEKSSSPHLPAPRPSKIKVKILWDSAQSVGFMLHLLNSHKKYQLKYCAFGRNIGNLRRDSNSVAFLHLQQCAFPAVCLLDQEGLPGWCHVPLLFHWRMGRSPFPPPALRSLFLVRVGTHWRYRDYEASQTQCWGIWWHGFGMFSLPLSVWTARRGGESEIL